MCQCVGSSENNSLLLVLVVVDVEVAELVRGLAWSHDAQEVTQLLGLEILFAQVLQIALRERSLCADMNLVLFPVNCHLVTAETSGDYIGVWKMFERAGKRGPGK